MTVLHGSTYYAGAVGLMLVGLYIVAAKKNLIKVILGLGLFETGVNLLFITVGYVAGGTAPIFSGQNAAPGAMVDPTPQALVLTAIVIGVATLALALALAARLYEHNKTLDLRKITGLRW